MPCLESGLSYSLGTRVIGIKPGSVTWSYGTGLNRSWFYSAGQWTQTLGAQQAQVPIATDLWFIVPAFFAVRGCRMTQQN